MRIPVILILIVSVALLLGLIAVDLLSSASKKDDTPPEDDKEVRR